MISFTWWAVPLSLDSCFNQWFSVLLSRQHQLFPLWPLSPALCTLASNKTSGQTPRLEKKKLSFVCFSHHCEDGVRWQLWWAWFKGTPCERTDKWDVCAILWKGITSVRRETPLRLKLYISSHHCYQNPQRVLTYISCKQITIIWSLLLRETVGA